MKILSYIKLIHVKYVVDKALFRYIYYPLLLYAFPLLFHHSLILNIIINSI